MATGAITSTNYGQHAISGAALTTLLDSITMTTTSGMLFIIPIANTNQVTVIKCEVAAS